MTPAPQLDRRPRTRLRILRRRRRLRLSIALALRDRGPGVRRTVDVVVAGTALLLLLPFLPLLALAIRLDSRGPIFFSQTRSGQRGRQFAMRKLRTMVVGADAQKAMLNHGIGRSYVLLFSEMNQGFNDGYIRRTETRSAANTTPTSPEEFSNTFAAVYNADRLSPIK